MNSDMVKPEKVGYLHLVYHFTVPLNDGFCHKIKATVDYSELFGRYRFPYCCNFLDDPPDLYCPDILWQSSKQNYQPPHG